MKFSDKVILLFVFLGVSAIAQAEQPSIGVTMGTGVSVTSRNTIRAVIDESLTEREEAAVEPMFELELASLELTDLEGRKLDGSQGREEKKTVVFFWSMYCRGCLPMVQKLQTLEAEFSKKNVNLVTVHMFENDVSKILNTLSSLGLKLPILLVSKEVRDLFSIRLLPTSLVFDARNKLTARFDGMVDSEGLRLNLLGKIETQKSSQKDLSKPVP